MSAPRGHRAVAGATADALPEGERPEAGPIAVLPKQSDRIRDAVDAGGGTVAALDDATRGIVWTANDDPHVLAEALRAHPRIGWVQLPWAGVDRFAHVLREEARPGLLWTSAKGAYAEPVAEHALALLLAAMRLLPDRARATSWGQEGGRSLYGAHVVIVGAGGIAVELLRLLAPFEVRTTVVRRSTDPVEGADRTVPVERLDEVLPDADGVVVAAAATADTRHLFDGRRLGLLPDRAVLVNIARGPLVDTDALVDALEAGALAGAGLDVTDPEPLPDGHPLWTAPNIVITPHSADTRAMTAPLLAERVRRNVEALHGDGRFHGVVDPAAGY